MADPDTPTAVPLLDDHAGRAEQAPSTRDGTWQSYGIPEPLPPRPR